MSEIIILNAILIAVSFLTFVQADLKVTQVQVVFRHGERTPRLSEICPNDINNASRYEPWGLGQLTNMGKIREYKIGQVLKTRYQKLLGKNYIPDAVYAVSTEFDRTKMSLQLVLAGLFPPSEEQTWNSELPWIPIPINYVPTRLDILMAAYSCPDFEDAMSEVLQLPEVQAKIAVHRDLLRFLTVKTGLNITLPTQAFDIYNLLIAQKAMNLTIPEWRTDAVFHQLSKIANLHFEIFSYTTRIKRLHGGQMVRRFIENMHLNKSKENPRKIYLYSGHDLNIATFLRAQGILEPKIPLYGAAVMFERLQDIDGNLFVRLVLWTGVTEQLITLRLPGCEDICPIKKYLQLTREVIPSDEETECLWKHLSARDLRNILNESINYN